MPVALRRHRVGPAAMTEPAPEPPPPPLPPAKLAAFSEELVHSVSLYRRRPLPLYGTLGPFAALYAAWFYLWVCHYGISQYLEAGLVSLAALGIAHVLTVLSGHWSVHVHCLLTCTKGHTRGTAQAGVMIRNGRDQDRTSPSWRLGFDQGLGSVSDSPTDRFAVWYWRLGTVTRPGTESCLFSKENRPNFFNLSSLLKFPIPETNLLLRGSFYSLLLLLPFSFLSWNKQKLRPFNLVKGRYPNRIKGGSSSPYCDTLESNPFKATWAKVVPTPNNGSPELQMQTGEKGCGEWKDYRSVAEIFLMQDEHQQKTISFEFQKIKYWFDENEKQFCPVAFPVNLQLRFYQGSKGFQDEKELATAERKYGSNKYVLQVGYSLAEMVVPEFMQLFKERATAPFFVFQ
eukprot:g47085.t1